MMRLKYTNKPLVTPVTYSWRLSAYNWKLVKINRDAIMILIL